MKLEDWLTVAHLHRGQLISEFTVLEIAIEYYLAEHFVLDGAMQNSFRSIVLNRMTFESKRSSFKTILEQKEIASGFIKTKSNTYPHSKLIDEIRRLNDERNYFAHYTLVANVGFDENHYVIGLAEFRDSTKYKWYTIDEFNTLMMRIRKATNDVLKLKNQ
ncbi:hypothetical protein ACFE6N_02705 [Pedobacter sp. BG31]|uniref:hypothetical protein n=1 Tax=Pedobacter sp. BG31 TaxID=3349697 RepID=UPI0035F34440